MNSKNVYHVIVLKGVSKEFSLQNTLRKKKLSKSFFLQFVDNRIIVSSYIGKRFLVRRLKGRKVSMLIQVFQGRVVVR